MLFTNSNNIPANQFIKIDTDIIEHRNCCKFLGLIVDDKLTWSEHISYTKSKISRSLYTMNWLKHMICKQYLKTLYDSLGHSYLSHGVILCGGTYSTHLNAIRVSQKKAVCCIYNSTYNAHTHPLFQDNKILKFADLYRFEVCKFVHNVLHEKVPRPLCDVFNVNARVHDHGTRHRNNPHVHQIRTVVAKHSLTHQAPKLWAVVTLEMTSLNKKGLFKHRLKIYYLEK